MSGRPKNENIASKIFFRIQRPQVDLQSAGFALEKFRHDYISQLLKLKLRILRNEQLSYILQ